MKQFSINELDILVINHSGEIFCLDGRCAHAGAPLAEGTIEGDVLTCPWHGSQYNITNGRVLRGPAEKSLKAYPVTLKEKIVFIDV